MTHCRCCVDKEEEEHPAPGNNIETVNSYDEAEGGNEEFPKGFKSDEG